MVLQCHFDAFFAFYCNVRTDQAGDFLQPKHSLSGQSFFVTCPHLVCAAMPMREI